MPEATKSRPRADAEALQRKLPLPPGYLPTIVQPNSETLAVQSIQPASRSFGGPHKAMVEQSRADGRDTCDYLPASLYRPGQAAHSARSKTPPPGQLYPAAWPVRNGLVNGTRMAANQEPIFCPKAPSSAATATLCFRRVARPLRRDDVVGRTSGTDMPANAVAGKSCKRPGSDDDTLHDT